MYSVFKNIPKQEIIKIRAKLRAEHEYYEGQIRATKDYLEQAEQHFTEVLRNRLSKVPIAYTDRAVNIVLSVTTEKETIVHKLRQDLSLNKKICRIAHLMRAFFDGIPYRQVEKSCHIEPSDWASMFIQTTKDIDKLINPTEEKDGPWTHELFEEWLKVNSIVMADVTVAHDGTGTYDEEVL